MHRFAEPLHPSLQHWGSKAPTARVPTAVFSEDWKQIHAEGSDQVPHSLLQVRVPRAELRTPSFTRDTKKQTKAAVEAPQVFQRDERYKGPMPACLGRSCKEKLCRVTRHNRDCLVNTKQRESPLCSIPPRKEGVEEFNSLFHTRYMLIF